MCLEGREDPSILGRAVDRAAFNSAGLGIFAKNRFSAGADYVHTSSSVEGEVLFKQRYDADKTVTA